MTYHTHVTRIIPETGLAAFLAEPKRASLFIQQLQSGFNIENLAFLIAVSPQLSNLRPLCGDQLVGLNACGSKSERITWIYNQFVKTGAVHEINVSYVARNSITNAFNGDVLLNKSPAVFYASVFRDLLRLLDQVHQEFTKL